jgi:uncharacterized protein
LLRLRRDASSEGVRVTRTGRFYIAGEAQASALVLMAPLSFWGGVSAETGAIIDHSHPDLGKSVRGRVLVMPGGRGSSSSSSVLAETLRVGAGPKAIILARADPILTVGALVALSLYSVACPIVVCPIDGIASGDDVSVEMIDEKVAKVHLGRR